MKFASLITLVLLSFGFPSTGRAEDAVTSLQSLTIQLWPDYDRPSVLVMMTGRLRTSAPLPGFVTLPLLPGAELHAVARADADGNLFDDVVYTTDAGKLSLSTPNPTFRVEYYVPYRVEAGESRFTFEWLADVAVESLSVIVQQPASATSFATQPPAANVGRGEDGLTYHVLPARAVPAREPLSVRLSYASTVAALSAKPRPASATPPKSLPEARLPAPPADSSGSRPGWGLLVAIVATAVVSVGITWQIAVNRFAWGAAGKMAAAGRPPVRPCPGCGLVCGVDDLFCRDCGQQLRGEG